MVDERASPSAGWREVYHEMDADPNVEAATRSCPDCGQTCENVLREVYECEEHGVFRASADGSESADAESDGSSDAREDADREGRRRADGPERRHADRDGSEASRRARDDSPDAKETYRARGPVGSD
ncbi:hypothetical protein M0R88_07540 [Halorussus gelatinilyticus]|uniref:Uncharacterized protein n=1 Tax=Halorussus gelatinilyticus TaxID=2937524 RepID=A0A8U0ILD7_9EURY|nr:hypothetical protein [Halorussus gelatinilyticus]UPW01940.1 hypothetical protein M0R88_07540 [Halorussus gelatinilyticus]